MEIEPEEIEPEEIHRLRVLLERDRGESPCPHVDLRPHTSADGFRRWLCMRCDTQVGPAISDLSGAERALEDQP